MSEVFVVELVEVCELLLQCVRGTIYFSGNINKAYLSVFVILCFQWKTMNNIYIHFTLQKYTYIPTYNALHKVKNKSRSLNILQCH